ncbi:winged helix-turn-helix domain-containing protein [Kribbella sp. CA-253562]|uniref:winged helix-turn-helix domain-containing protein n=1 Tax=Kribbella sp. CA-253562 TaxID=3239942 RepID=UPI003D9277EC
MVTARVPAPRDDGTIDHQDFPLLIAVAASPEERVRLAELVDDVAPLLLVSSLDELRKLLVPAQDPPPSAPAEQSAPSQAGTASAGADALTIDSQRSVAQWRGREVPLTDLEHDLLTRLMTEPVRVWTYEALHQAVWRNRHQRGTGDVHSLVKRVRRKLDDLGTTVTIDAVRGTGFRLADHQRPAITGLRAG